MSENDNSSDKEISSPSDTQIKKALRTERFLKIGVALMGVATVGVISLFVYNYISARTGEPKSYYEFQLDTLEFWQDVVKKNPKDSTSHTNLGFAYARMGRNGRAIAEYKTAIKLDSKNADAYLHLSRLYVKIGQKDNAISHLTKAAKYAPQRARALAYFTLGEIYEEKNDLDRAFDYYMKSAKDEPLMWNAHFKLGQFYERDGDKESALAEYKEAEKFNPENQKIKESIERLSK